MYCMFLSIFDAWIYVSCTAFAPIVTRLLLLNQNYTVMTACMHARVCVACQSQCHSDYEQDLYVCRGVCVCVCVCVCVLVVGIIESLRGRIVNCTFRLYYCGKCTILETTITIIIY